jgi:hypothetical protein
MQLRERAMKTSGLRKTSSFLLLFAGVATICHLSMAEKYNMQSGIYCLDNGVSVFMEKPEPYGNLTVGMVTSGENGSVFSIYGKAGKVGPNHWRYEEGMNSSDAKDRCQIDILYEKTGWNLAVRKNAPCLNAKGAGGPDAPVFPFKSYVTKVTKELDTADGLYGDVCHPMSRPASATPAQSVPKP